MAVDNKKEQERDELHRAIWAIADELRGAVDGWDLYWLTEKCKILLTCCILNLLGLTNKEINLCCEKSPIIQIIDSFPLELD